MQNNPSKYIDRELLPDFKALVEKYRFCGKTGNSHHLRIKQIIEDAKNLNNSEINALITACQKEMKSSK